MVYVGFPPGPSKGVGEGVPHDAHLLHAAPQPHVNMLDGQQQSITMPQGGEYRCLHVLASVCVHVPQPYHCMHTVTRCGVCS